MSGWSFNFTATQQWGRSPQWRQPGSWKPARINGSEQTGESRQRHAVDHPREQALIEACVRKVVQDRWVRGGKEWRTARRGFDCILIAGQRVCFAADSLV